MVVHHDPECGIIRGIARKRVSNSHWLSVDTSTRDQSGYGLFMTILLSRMSDLELAL